MVGGFWYFGVFWWFLGAIGWVGFGWLFLVLGFGFVDFVVRYSGFVSGFMFGLGGFWVGVVLVSIFGFGCGCLLGCLLGGWGGLF